MAVIPPLVTNIVQSADWERTVAKMREFERSGKKEWSAWLNRPDEKDLQSQGEKISFSQSYPGWMPGSKEWEAEFERQYLFLKAKYVDRLARKTIDHKTYESVSKTTKLAAAARLKAHLHSILAEGKLKPGSMVEKKQNNGYDLPAQLNVEFFKHFVTLPAKVEHRAQLKLEGRGLWMTVAGTFCGNWDPRLVTQFVPATESLLNPKTKDELSLRIAAEIKSKCVPFEDRANELFMWHLVMFPAEPLPPPQIDTSQLPTSSPWQLGKMALETGLETHRIRQERIKQSPNLSNAFSVWLPSATSWLPFALALRFIDPHFLEKQLNDDIDTIAFLSHAASGYQFSPNVCFACSKPLVFETTDEGRFHNPDGPAVAWSDGLKTYAWKGVVVSADLIEEKESLTSSRISKENNTEIRRVMMEIFGESRYLMESNAKAISWDQYGTLYQLEIPGDEPLCMVRVRNSTSEPDGTFKYYFLRVPPTIKTATEAVAWTFGFEERKYRPQHQT